MKLLAMMPTRGRYSMLARESFGVAMSNAGVPYRHEACMTWHVTAGRNHAARTLLKHEDCTHLFMVDDDVPIPPDAVARLLETMQATDAHVVSGVTPYYDLRNHRVLSNVSIGQGMLPLWPVGVHEAAVCGSSCLLIRREVFEALDFPWFTWTESRSGTLVGEDIDFSTRCRQRGFRLVFDGRVRCQHLAEVELSQFAACVGRDASRGHLAARVIGTPRSGTGYMAALLRSMGLDVGHESFGRDGIAAWFFAAALPAQALPMAEIARGFTYGMTIHVAREPLSCIASLVDTHVAHDDQRWRAYVEAAVGPLQGDDVQQACEFWLRWTRLCLCNDLAATVQVEHAPSIVPGLLQRYGYEPYEPSEIPRDVNTRPHRTLTWEAIADAVPAPLYAELTAMRRRLGYGD